MEFVDHVPGSAVRASYLNEFQDDYVQSGFESWKLFGQTTTIDLDSSTLSGSTHSLAIGNWNMDEVIRVLTAIERQQKLFFIDPPNDFPVAGGVARTIELKLRAYIWTNDAAPGAPITSIGLHGVTGVDGTGSPTYGSAVQNSVITPGQLSPKKQHELESGIITGLAAGLKAIRLAIVAPNANSNVAVRVLLLHREI